MTTLRICPECLPHLYRPSNAVPPRLSIANGNAIGRLPDQFWGLTRTEEQCIALVAHCVSMTTIIGGTLPNVLKSHSYFVNNTEGPIANMIPASVVGNARVTMVGSMTTSQKAQCKKLYGVRLELTRSAMEFICATHRVYINNRVQLGDLAPHINDTVFIDRTDDSCDPLDQQMQERLADADIAHNTVGNTAGDANEDLPSVDTAIIDRRTFIIRSGTPESKSFVVTLSNDYTITKRFGHIIVATPTLFPGGSGGPNEQRWRQLSVTEWVRRCLRIHGGRFGRHYGFSMLAFGYLSREAASRSLYDRLSVNMEAVRAGRITTQVLDNCIQYVEEVRAKRKVGVRLPEPPEDVQRVLDLRRGIRRGEAAS